VGGAAGVMDVGAARGAGGAMGTTWSAIEVVGALWGTTKVGEAGGDEAMQCMVV
jgi:hypothetical protein